MLRLYWVPAAVVAAFTALAGCLAHRLRVRTLSVLALEFWAGAHAIFSLLT
jgi:hypothetical protein